MALENSGVMLKKEGQHQQYCFDVRADLEHAQPQAAYNASKAAVITFTKSLPGE
ncbi:MAG: hypothetical protein JO066_10875 [Verrucomicrobia bacterium]|nr:hypothetical protein [Verrucomicrobiota bacterium]